MEEIIPQYDIEKTRPENMPAEPIVPPQQGSTPQQANSEETNVIEPVPEQAITDRDIEEVKSTNMPVRRNAPLQDESQSNRQDEPEEAGPKFGNWQDVLDFVEERKAAIHLPSKEELEKERRRKKTEGIISALSDGASAVANLIYTSQYAPNMYNEKNTLTGEWEKRYDKLKKEREAEADRYLNYAMMIGKIKDAREAKEYQRGRDALQDRIRMSQEERAQLKADREAAMAELRMDLMQGKIDQAAAAARVKEIEAEYADRYWGARVQELDSRKKKNDRWRPSTRGGGVGGGKGGRHPWRDTQGRLGEPGKIYYENSSTGAQEMAAMYDGEYLTVPNERQEEVTAKSKDKFGNDVTKTTTKKTTTNKSKKSEKKKKPNPMS